MADWVPLSQVLGNIPAMAMGGGGVAVAAAAEPQLVDLPPNLHWSIVLILGLITRQLFNLVWALLQGNWARKLSGDNKPLVLVAMYPAGMVAGVLTIVLFRVLAALGGLFFIAGAIVYLVRNVQHQSRDGGILQFHREHRIATERCDDILFQHGLHPISHKQHCPLEEDGCAQVTDHERSMPSPRTRRLMLDEETLQRLLQGWPLIQITGKAGIPPEIYRFTYNLRGLYVSGSGEILERDSHVLEVNLTLGYPRRAPQCRMLTPVFHPNFDDSMVCIGDFWAASEGLDQLIIRIGRMISYQEYNTKSPLNGLAAKWAAQNSHLLPIDPRPIAPPFNDAGPIPAPPGGEATPSPQPPVEIPAPVPVVDEQWPDRIVIASEPPAISVPDVPKPVETKIEAAPLADGGGSRDWMRVISISVLVVALAAFIVWLGLYRQRHFGAGKHRDAAEHTLRQSSPGRRPRSRAQACQLCGAISPEL